MQNLSQLSNLPIAPHLGEICTALKESPSHFLVLTAETAAGKSTAVPLALLEAFAGKILMLEPRRLATVAIASRVAELLGEQAGGLAGYRLHLESRVSARTRLEVITEAILTRRLQSDPSLEGVSVVVIDEFHERSVHADLALAFLKEAMLLRDDLYVIVMSATIDTKAVSAYLDDAPVLQVPGRQFPVAVSYLPGASPAQAVLQELSRTSPVAPACPAGSTGAEAAGRAVAAAATTAAFRQDSILVFLPGIGDIRRTKQELEAAGLCSSEAAAGTASAGQADAEVFVLHSSVPLSEQKAVLAPVAASAPRRVILSSAIAETSLTVPGVTTVIDSGLARINRMNVALGMEHLVTERESLFSAEQRAGRAGRLAPGRCIRLWNQFDALLTVTPPEISRTDLVPLVLECAAWGVSQPEKLDWLDPPPASAWKAAQELLAELGCISKLVPVADIAGKVSAMTGGKITPRGKAALSLGLHPRLACTVLFGLEKGALAEAVASALRFSTYAQSPARQQDAFCADISRRALASGFGGRQGQAAGAGGAAGSAAGGSDSGSSAPGKARAGLSAALLLLAGFPDRIGRRTSAGGSEYQFPSGRKAQLYAAGTGRAPAGGRGAVTGGSCGGSTGAKIGGKAAGAAPAYLVAPEVDAGSTTARIYSYEPLDEETALSWLMERAETYTETVFAEEGAAGSGKGARLIKTEYTAYGALVLKERRLAASPEDYSKAVCAAVSKKGLSWLPLSDASRSLLVRARFYADHGEAARCASREQVALLQEKLETLAVRPEDWLLPFLAGGRGSGAVSAQTVYDALSWYLDAGEIDRQVPVQILLANGKKRRLVYEDSGKGVQPVLEVIIQQIFGCFETPRVLGVPVLLKLLSPARRPLQITEDLAGFWKGSWLEICKEMKGRYPKHNWDYRVAEED